MHRIALCLTLLLAVSAADVAADAPNVVILLADDLGWNAVGYHNDEFQTPNIDALVAGGVELDRFYVAPMCSPTRAGLMTGLYPIRFGCARAVIPPQRDYGLPTEQITVAEVLEKIGYENRGVFGKWHLGHRRAKWHPLNQGFTHFHGHYNGAIDYFELTRENVRDWHTNYEPSDEQGYSTDLIAAAASQWITQSAKSDAPYFCYVPFNAPHSPFQAPEDAIARFRSPDSNSDGGNKRGRKGQSYKGQANKERDREVYAAMIWQMDQGIGQILKAIEDSGEAENTIVWFMSDNGGVGGLRELNEPLRGSKLTVYEGGIRVPACIRWPKRLLAGDKSHDIFGYIDVLPTLIAAAGADQWDLMQKPLDGTNILPVLMGLGKNPAWGIIADRPWFSYHGQSGEQDEHLAVTLDGWKLKVNGPRLRSLKQLTDGTNRVELFHLSADLLEKSDVKAMHPDKVQQLGEMLIEHRTLQPADGVPPYGVGKQGFVPPANWAVDPKSPDKLVGTDG
ncbi:sulfatase-like hydrolase/transferase [Stieleria varia]|uniref:Arylsulfatase n=1 Tax=Stieleria varia TaxID=2528005 RepID=A0A5C6B362_9BACT|nr:sulfatase-like hydrolase/transferase [Stieleria varia]TWU06227.1 Arylsulfatase precursor [Stieleria varia]